MKELKAMFEPKSVAIIGASRNKSAVGYSILNNLVNGFKGKIFPVNPKAAEIDGLRCYPSVMDISGDVDLAVIVIKNNFVPFVMKECAEKGVKAVIIISAGFREIGVDGKILEQEVIDIAREYGISVIGPNCLGVINTDPSIVMNASFSRVMPKSGNVAFISQSGALCTAVLDYVKDKNIGFSKFISVGNKADINVVDLVRYLKDDPKTDVILMYIEDLIEVREFIEIARETALNGKPILAIKSGRTPQGAKAASSHTGSLMGADEVYDAMFDQAGVLRMDSVADIFDYTTAFANQLIPKGDRVAIVTNAGGPGIIATDACVRYGIKMAKFEEATTQRLKECLPSTANISNPVDVIGDARHDRYESVLDQLIEDSNVDGIIIILTPQSVTNIKEIADVIVSYCKKTDKTILTCFMGSSDIAKGVKVLEREHIPHYSFPEDAAKTFAGMVHYRDMCDRKHVDFEKYHVDVDTVESIIAEAKNSGETFLTINQGMDIFKAYGFPTLPYGFGKDKEDVVSIAGEIGFPVVLKVVSRDIIHKFDVGGVVMNLNSKEDVAEAYEKMRASIALKLPDVDIDGVFIQSMGKAGREVILGMNHDAHFGDVMMFGLGGIYVEALKDVSFRVAPIQEYEARQMIKDIRTHKILEGLRGEKPSDIETIVDCLKRLSQLSCDHPDIKEIDINPLLVYEQGQGARVVDARIVIQKK